MSDYRKSINKKEYDAIIREADNSLNNIFNLFNVENRKNDTIPWHTDINSGFEWKKGKYYLDYKQIDLNNNADVKYPRELSRSHFLLYLGEAYLLTENIKYAKKIVNIIEDWLQENPFLFSINWGCAMDVAIRAVNQAYAVGMILDSNAVTEEFLNKFSVSLYQHAWFVYKNQESNYYNNANHYDSNIVALLFLGIVFEKLDQGKKWYDHAKEELFFEMRQQILPSGVVYEKSYSYGRLVTEMFTFAYCLLLKAEKNIPNDISYRIEKQFDFIFDYTKSNGLSPIIGDIDDARWLPFTPIPRRDHRHLLSLGASLFARGDWKAKSIGYISDVYFMNSKCDKATFEALKSTDVEPRSTAYKDAGYFFMKNKNIHLLINHAGLSKYQESIKNGYIGSHTHADLLSFELSFGKTTYLVDPGSFVYTSNPSERNKFRSTAMHNTVSVDKQDQLLIRDNDLFGYYSNIYPKIINWYSDKNKDVFVGEHNGYLRLVDPVIHRRNIAFNKKENKIDIIDLIIGKDQHDIEVFFHFNAGIFIEDIGDSFVKAKTNEPKVMLLKFESEKPFLIEIFDSFISKQYGKKLNSKSLRLILKSELLPVEMKTIVTFE